MYGMPDFNDMASRFPEAVVEIQRALKTSIEQYEPRLKRVRIKHLPDAADPLHLRFEITAQLVTGEDDAAIWFETALDTSGQISIRG
jgi:type VI secretion system protein